MAKNYFFDIEQADYFSVVLSICFIDYICIVKQHMNVLNNESTNTMNFARVSDIKIPDIYFRKFKTGIQDLDEAFGGEGFLPGAVMTLAAPAGVGKSVLSLQLLQALENTGKKTAFISGEESLYQVCFAATRINATSVRIANLTYVEDIEQSVIQHGFDFIVIDSFPTIRTKRKDLKARERETYIIGKLVSLAKAQETCMLIIQHCTKDGKYVGRTELVHSADAQYTLQKNPDDYGLRDLIAVKNRFGQCSFTTFPFGAQGYTFEAVEDTSNETPMTKTKKTSKADIILECLTTPKTAAQIVEETNVGGAYLTSILRELVTQGKASKEGRGADATYIKK